MASSAKTTQRQARVHTKFGQTKRFGIGRMFCYWKTKTGELSGKSRKTQKEPKTNRLSWTNPILLA